MLNNITFLKTIELGYLSFDDGPVLEDSQIVANGIANKLGHLKFRIEYI